MTKHNDQLGDQRLTKTSGTLHVSRSTADDSRTKDDGLELSDEARRKMIRQDWIQEVLPAAPKMDGFHCCWLSTTNSTDPIYKRVQRGYMPVKATEIPGIGGQFTVKEGEFDGCVSCNEMLLFKIPLQLYNDLMTIYHSDMPSEQEAAIRENVNANNPEDSNGRRLAHVEGDFNNLGRGNNRSPTFIS